MRVELFAGVQYHCPNKLNKKRFFLFWTIYRYADHEYEMTRAVATKGFVDIQWECNNCSHVLNQTVPKATFMLHYGSEWLGYPRDERIKKEREEAARAKELSAHHDNEA